MRIINTRGYSFLEVVVVLVIVGLGLGAVAVNLPSSLAMIEPESVLVQSAGVMLEAKKEALLGTINETKRSFSLQNALKLPHGTVSISVIPSSYGKICPNGEFNQNQICVSGHPFRFEPTNTFTFERFSGKTSQPHALFISNTRRKLALLISESGNYTVAELTNNEWRTRTDLQQLFPANQKVIEDPQEK